MKFIAQVLVYNEADYLRQAVEPWVSVCECINIFEGAFQTTINLGYPKRSTDGTCEIGQQLAKNHPNATYKEHNYWNEPILRNDHLFWTVRDFGRDDTCLFILDGDEVYTPEEVKKCVEQVQTQWDKYNTLWVSMKNYMSPTDFYYGFRVPRFFKLKNAMGFCGYNDIAFSDGIQQTDIHGVLPAHYSWWGLEKAKRKVLWQNTLGWETSHIVVDDKVVLNDSYYQNTGKIKPIIYHD